MNANDLIESYVTEVAVLLPRKQRNDVAFELRALLHEELQDRAEAEGRTPDAAMATALLQAFGRPEEVAARYRPTLTIIDPADGHAFLRATVVGLAILWSVGLLENLQPLASGWDILTILAGWWLGTVIPSLWWPGVLVMGYGLAAWGRRRSSQTAVWKPRTAETIQGGRTAIVLGLIGCLCGTYILLEPRWLLDVIWNGKAAPAAYEALTYTETFRQRQAPWLLGLLLVNIPLFITVIVKGRRPALLQRLETGLILATCAAMAWTILDGPVFLASSSDRMTKVILTLIVASTLLYLVVQLRRRVKPAPTTQIQS